jgi:cytochrome P450
MEFAPDDLAFIADPHPVYTELRERTPIVLHEPTDHWLISRYEDVNALLRDRRFGRTYHHLASDEQIGRPSAPEWHARSGTSCGAASSIWNPPITPASAGW